MLSVQPKKRHPIDTVVDLMLVDTAIKIQLSAANYAKATRRYKTIAAWIDRPGSPLAGHVVQIYPQGSMAIGAAIASKLKEDEYDIDLIAEIDIDSSASPKSVLDKLYESIRGEKGSQYYDMTFRRTRCVTVQYADGMHIDITPAQRIHQLEERTSYIFHSKPENHTEMQKRIMANPFGFAEWFKLATQTDSDFAGLFDQHLKFFTQDSVRNSAEVEDIPEQELPYEKSMALIALQLMKRWRNVQYDTRDGRRPPSVMMAQIIGDAAGKSNNLTEELIWQAQNMLTVFQQCQNRGELICVTNPACSIDHFTDRWPANLHEQNVFIKDLGQLLTALQKLTTGLSLQDNKKIMMQLFGENVVATVFENFAQRTGNSIQAGTSYTSIKQGKFDLAASGAFGIVPNIAQASVRTPAHTFFGN